MGGLVDDLLFLARFDQGRPLERETVDLRRVVQDAVDDARASTLGHPIELVAPQPVVVTGDPDRLGQVAHNLVRNALAHTDGRRCTSRSSVGGSGPSVGSSTRGRG